MYMIKITLLCLRAVVCFANICTVTDARETFSIFRSVATAEVRVPAAVSAKPAHSARPVYGPPTVAVQTHCTTTIYTGVRRIRHIITIIIVVVIITIIITRRRRDDPLNS